MADKPCPYKGKIGCAIAPEANPHCDGWMGECDVQEAYELGFERGKENRPKGAPASCRIFVNGQDVTAKVLTRLRPFKKKPITIKACQMNYPFEVDTLEGRMKGGYGDFVIQGVKKELYPCAQEIFLEIHEVPDPTKAKAYVARETRKAVARINADSRRK